MINSADTDLCAAAAEEERVHGGSTDAQPSAPGPTVRSVYGKKDDEEEALEMTTTGRSGDVVGEEIQGSGSLHRLLTRPSDSSILTPLLCLLRSQIEVFVVTPEIRGDARYRQNQAMRIDIGRVGIRCVHCVGSGSKGTAVKAAGPPVAAVAPPPSRTNGAVSYPKSMRLVYQCSRNMRRYHLILCPALPEEVRAEFDALSQGGDKRSNRDAPIYWADCCKKMGMVDTEASGIRLRKGRFFEDSDGGDDSPTDVVTGRSAPAELPARRPAEAMSSGAMSTSSFEEVTEINGSTGTARYDSSADVGTSSYFEGVNGNIGRPNIAQTCEATGNSSRSPEATEVTANSFTAAAAISLPAASFPVDAGDLNDGAMASRESTEAAFDNGSEHNNDQFSIPQQTMIPHAAVQINASPSILGTDFGLDQHSTTKNSQPRQEEQSRCNLPSEQDGGDDLRSTSVPPSEGTVLERVRVALSTVLAVGQIEQLTASATANDAGESNLSQDDSGDLSFLGVQLYELFAGRSPFNLDGDDDGGASGNGNGRDASAEGDDTHQQQRKKEKRLDASAYTTLSEMGLPPALCTLVSSLLDPPPRDGGRARDDDHFAARPQSMRDVEEDLRLMLCEPENFLLHPAPAVTGTFSLASKNALYGREEETDQVLDAYDCAMDTSPGASQSKGMVLVTGYSGTGKSSLVRSACGQLVERGACFVSGKFDAMRQLQPLSPIVSAVDEYCGLLAADVERIDGVREAVGNAVGREGWVVLEGLIPNIRKVISPAEDGRLPTAFVPQVNGQEALQRLIFMIRMLFRVTCSRSNRPVVMFIDDLQWADETSLLLMHALVTDATIEGLIFVGCYRDNKVGPDHPLFRHISAIRRAGLVNITSICVGNLNIRSVKLLLSGTLHLTPRMTGHLAEVVLQKTGGNALFVVQFISSLHDEGLIYFSFLTRRWQWDIFKIRDKELASTVVELMTAKFLRFAQEVLEALRLVAGFGAQCQEEILHIIDRAPDRVGNTAAALDITVAEGIMSKVGSVYIFCHDQIQQAAYQLVPESDRASFHLQIGRLLWKLATNDEIESYIYVLVDQLHRGSSLIIDRNEKVQLAQLSLLAGKTAYAMSAFLPASAYLNAGIGLLVETDWICHRDLCFSLYNLCAETEYIIGEFVSMQRHLESVLSRAEGLKEQLRAYHTLVLGMGAQGHAFDALQIASNVLSQLGEVLPDCATEETVKREIGMTLQLLSTHTEDSLLRMKTMEDVEKLEVMRFLHVFLTYTYVEKGRSEYVPLPVCRLVRLSVLHGFCKESALGFASFGFIQCAALNNPSGGYRHGKLALNIIERFQAKECFAKVSMIVHACVNPFIEPVQACLPPLKLATEVGLGTGDVEYAMMAANCYMFLAFGSGKALGPLLEEMQLYSQQMLEHNRNSLLLVTKPCIQATSNLLGRSTDPTKLVGEEMNEDSLLSSVEDPAHVTFLCGSFRMWLEYIFGKYSLAWSSWEKVSGKSFALLIPTGCNNSFYGCLSALALARKEGVTKYSETIETTIGQMEAWTRSAPWNCLNKLELMKAERAYLMGDFVAAEGNYEHAIDLSEKRHFIHEQALALERCGIFHMERGTHAVASALFVRSRDCYIKWGAKSKADHISTMFL